MFTEQLQVYGCVYFMAEIMALTIMLVMLNLSRQSFAMAKKYTERFTFYYYKTNDGYEALNEFAYSLGERNPLRHILLKAIKKSKGRGSDKKDLKAAFDYIERFIGCMPVKVINSVIISIDGRLLPRAVVSSIGELRENWEKEVIAERKEAFKELCIFFLTKELLLLVNTLFFYYFNSQECLYILMAVHGMGLVFMIFFLLDNRYKIRGNINPGNLSFIIWAHTLIVLFIEDDVKNAIIKSYDYCPKLTRRYIKNIRMSLVEDDSVIPVVSRGAAMVDVKKENSFIGVLYENLDKSGETAIERISPKMKELYEEIHDSNMDHIKRKSKTFAGGLRNAYQILGSLGVMLNVIQLLTVSIGSFM